MKRRTLLFGLVGGTVLMAVGCGGRPEETMARPPGLAAFGGLKAGVAAAEYPAFVTAVLRDAYQFALERPDVLRVLPCYCGCGLTSGHTSNLDCFIAGVRQDGSVVFDQHGSYCQTCVDIARDAKRLIADGQSLPSVRTYVDQRHGNKGPGTDTPRPDSAPKGT